MPLCTPLSSDHAIAPRLPSELDGKTMEAVAADLRILRDSGLSIMMLEAADSETLASAGAELLSALAKDGQ